jgi:hypothetical protein
LAHTDIEAKGLLRDSGSSNPSIATVESLASRGVHTMERGDGAESIAGIKKARGRFAIMGDVGYRYEFAQLDGVLARLRSGDDLVSGIRFRDCIESGGMPFLHRYLGNPVLRPLG